MGFRYDNMSDHYKIFNKALKELIDMISNELSNDSLMSSVSRRYVAAVATDRTILLTEVGKELFVFRDYIAEGRWDDLINYDWAREAAERTGESGPSSTLNSMISTIRSVWARYDESERKQIKKLIKTMLKSYVQQLMQK